MCARASITVRRDVELNACFFQWLFENLVFLPSAVFCGVVYQSLPSSFLLDGVPKGFQSAVVSSFFIAFF